MELGVCMGCLSPIASFPLPRVEDGSAAFFVHLCVKLRTLGRIPETILAWPLPFPSQPFSPAASLLWLCILRAVVHWSGSILSPGLPARRKVLGEEQEHWLWK